MQGQRGDAQKTDFGHPVEHSLAGYSIGILFRKRISLGLLILATRHKKKNLTINFLIGN